jgi:hypothetical protein
MMPTDLTGTRLAAVFLLGVVLLNFPVLAIFARPVEVAGVPLLYGYVFGAWFLLVGLMAWVIEHRH